MLNLLKTAATRDYSASHQGASLVAGNIPAAETRTRWISKLQRLYGVNKADAESVVDDVLKVMTFIR